MTNDDNSIRELTAAELRAISRRGAAFRLISIGRDAAAAGRLDLADYVLAAAQRMLDDGPADRELRQYYAMRIERRVSLSLDGLTPALRDELARITGEPLTCRAMTVDDIRCGYPLGHHGRCTNELRHRPRAEPAPPDVVSEAELADVLGRAGTAARRAGTAFRGIRAEPATAEPVAVAGDDVQPAGASS